MFDGQTLSPADGWEDTGTDWWEARECIPSPSVQLEVSRAGHQTLIAGVRLSFGNVAKERTFLGGKGGPLGHGVIAELINMLVLSDRLSDWLGGSMGGGRSSAPGGLRGQGNAPLLMLAPAPKWPTPSAPAELFAVAVFSDPGREASRRKLLVDSRKLEQYTRIMRM